jgi:poly-gamma-glutamate capsule biosynthesis protein CapA/YwtB (metallophosphatase superfamily)
MMPSIGVLGDVMLGRGVAQRLNQSVTPTVWGEALLALTASLDLVIANLECCLAIGGRPTRRIPRKPFFFRGPRSATAQLRQLNVRAVGLANNHALDYEEWALGETLAVLEHAGIAVAGAGRGSAARRPAVVAAGGTRVGLVAIADHPAEYAAREGHLGIAYVDLRRELPAWLPQTLADLRASCDAVIAFPHWGPNMASEPQPWQRRRAVELQAAGGAARRRALRARLPRCRMGSERTDPDRSRRCAGRLPRRQRPSQRPRPACDLASGRCLS